MGFLCIANPTWIKTEIVHDLVIAIDLRADPSLHKNYLAIVCRRKTTDTNQEQHFKYQKRAPFGIPGQAEVIIGKLFLSSSFL